MIETHWLGLVAMLFIGMSIGLGIAYSIMKEQRHE